MGLLPSKPVPPPKSVPCPRCTRNTKPHCDAILSHTCDLVTCTLDTCGYGTKDGKHWYRGASV